MTKQIQIFKDHKLLICLSCGNEYSSTYGDYFAIPDQHKFVCDNCNTSMILAEKCEVYNIIKRNPQVSDLKIV